MKYNVQYDTMTANKKFDRKVSLENIYEKKKQRKKQKRLKRNKNRKICNAVPKIDINGNNGVTYYLEVQEC